MSVRRRLTRNDATHDSLRKNQLRGYAMFVRFMDKRRLSDCVHYFPEDMTLGRLRDVTRHDLLMTYRVSGLRDRERIMNAVEESRVNDSSDTESDHGLSSSPSHSGIGSPVQLRHRADDASLRKVRMLHRTVSEDFKGCRRESLVTNTSPLAQSRHLSSSQLALGLGGIFTSQSDSATNLARLQKSGLGKSAPNLSTSLLHKKSSGDTVCHTPSRTMRCR